MIRRSVSKMTTPSGYWVSPTIRISASRVTGSKVPPPGFGVLFKLHVFTCPATRRLTHRSPARLTTLGALGESLLARAGITFVAGANRHAASGTSIGRDRLAAPISGARETDSATADAAIAE